MGEDYFSKSPPEVLLKILVHVPASDYLALARTSKLLRNLMKVNAATICNNRIKEIHPKAAELLHSTLVDKWLMPRHPAIGKSPRADLIVLAPKTFHCTSLQFNRPCRGIPY